MAVTRYEIRKELKTLISNYVSGYFGSYPTVNIKNYDIAGTNEPEYYPIVNIVTTNETFPPSPIGKSDRDMNCIIDVIPWADEVNGMQECDKIFQEFPNVIFSNPQWSNYAIDTIIEDATLLRLGTDCPTLKVRFQLIIKYREARPL